MALCAPMVTIEQHHGATKTKGNCFEPERGRERERERLEPGSSENERARVVFGRWATKARGWPVRVDLSEDKGEGESIHQHGVCPPFGRWAGGRSIRSIAGGGSYQDLKLPPTLSCLG